ncbi:MAG TPA: xylose isomerase, partial [Sphingobacteriaceae bacterium]|nr:xylose isomerase [Sphingobacteriaceae bacterium]
MYRRSFLKTSGVVAAATLLPGLSNAEALFSAFKAKYPPPGLQMYTLRVLFDAPGADTKAILKQIADIGIKELESASGADGLYYGHKPKELAAM